MPPKRKQTAKPALQGKGEAASSPIRVPSKPSKPRHIEESSQAVCPTPTKRGRPPTKLARGKKVSKHANGGHVNREEPLDKTRDSDYHPDYNVSYESESGYVCTWNTGHKWVQ